MNIINFAHPVTSAQIAEVEALTGKAVTGIISVPTQIDMSAALADQIAALVDEVGYTSHDWQTKPFIVNVPGMANAAALTIAEIHGRCGHFPPILRITGRPGDFHVQEVLDLQGQRATARTRR